VWAYVGDPYANYKVDHSIQWKDFIKDCGKAVPLEAVRKVYAHKYQGKIVEWEG
jgi:hypothetical protein